MTKAAKIAPGIDLRNEAIACLALPDLRFVRKSREFNQPRGSVCVDGRHDRYAVARPDGGIEICGLANDETLLRLPGKDGTFPQWLSFSDDARWLFVTFSDKSCRLMDLASGRMLWELTDAPGATIAEFLPNRRQVAIREADDRALAIYDLATGERVRSLPLPFAASQVRFSPTGDSFAVSRGFQKSVPVLDSTTGKTLVTLQHDSGVHDIAWDPAGNRPPTVDDPGGQRLATACEGSGVHFWDTKTGRQLAQLGDGLKILSIAFRADGHILAGSDWERTRIWDVRTRQQLAMEAVAGGWLEFSTDGSRLSSHGWKRESFQVLDVASGDECRAIDMGQNIYGLASSPRLGLFAAWGSTRALLFDAEMRNSLAWFRLDNPPVFFDTFGTSLFTENRGRLWCWPMKSVSATGLEIGPREKHSIPNLKNCQLTGDGQAFVAAFDDRLSIYDATTLTLRTSTPARFDRPSVATSPDGEWIATGSWNIQGVQVWNARTGKLVRALPSAGVSIVSFSPDGRWLAVRGKRDCQLWNVGAWTSHIQLENTPGDEVGCAVAFTQDARIAALRSGRSNVLLIETATGRELALLESPEPHDISHLCFTADDTKLVVALNQHPLRVWDLRRIRQQLAGMGLDWEAPPLPLQLSKPLITTIKVIVDPPPAQ